MKRCQAHRGKPKLKRGDIRGAKYLEQILDLLRPLHGHCDDPKRTLHYDEYCAYLLLYFFTPVLTSLRGLQQASEFESLQRKLGLRRFSLGSFSESGTVFDPALLVPIIEQISGRLADLPADDPRLSALGRRPTAVDGSLLHALPKMVWALWLDEANRAAKVHLHFDLVHGVPETATLTAGQASEIQQLKDNLCDGRLYVTDRGYFDYSLMAAILKAHSSFVARVRDNIVYEVIEERPVSKKAAQAGVLQDAIVQPGCKNTRAALKRPLRLVRIHVRASTASGQMLRNRVDAKTKAFRQRQTDHVLLLLTDQLDLDVELIALLYRQRWQVELFFRWFKKVLAAHHLLSLDEGGLTIVIYCALMASMLVVLWTGRKPTKRTFELLCFYFGGWLSDEELLRHLERLAAADSKTSR